MKRCSHCHIFKPLEEFCKHRSMKDGRYTECRICANRNRHRYPHTTMKQRFYAAKGSAKKDHRIFTLTFKEYATLRELPCSYCGFPLPPTGAGIDRKDNALDYTAQNSVPCCFECNRCKGATFTYEEMLLIGAAIRTVKQARPKGEENGKHWSDLKLSRRELRESEESPANPTLPDEWLFPTGG